MKRVRDGFVKIFVAQPLPTLALPEVAFEGHYAAENDLDDQGRQIIRIDPAVFRAALNLTDGGNTGGGTTPQPLALDIQNSNPTPNYGTGDSAIVLVTATGGAGGYHSWEFTELERAPGAVDFGFTTIEGLPNKIQVTGMAWLGTFRLKVKVLDSANTLKEAIISFVTSSFPSGGGGSTPTPTDFKITLRPRSKTDVDEPDDSIDYYIDVANAATGDINYTTSMVGSGGHGTEPLDERPNGSFVGQKAFAHSLRTNGGRTLTVNAVDAAGKQSSATVSFSVTGWPN
jgi:hypothetical protein